MPDFVRKQIIIFAIIMSSIFVLGIFLEIISSKIRHKRYLLWCEEVRALSTGARAFAPHELLRLKPRQVERYNVPGIYIIHNNSKDMYYVGQSKTMLSRIRKHFTGTGNGDVYADYKYGDDFTVKVLRLDKSGYQNLDSLERDNIAAFGAYEKGYNRNEGKSLTY